jgi:peptide-methionine (R)-S-oxide reductase
MERRSFLKGLSLTALALSVPGRSSAREVSTMNDIADLQKNWRALLAPGADVATSTAPLNRPNTEWRKLLSPQQYDVLRQEGTEYPGTSPLNGEHRAGVFVCAACSLPLFTSDMKFDSGTGWPSFFTTIPGVFAHKKDFQLVVERNEYHCVRCGGHHGHVFDDGPAPTHQRWCNNGVVLRFIPKQGKG